MIWLCQSEVVTGLRIFGSEDNLIFGGRYLASLISSRKELLPQAGQRYAMTTLTNL